MKIASAIFILYACVYVIFRDVSLHVSLAGMDLHGKRDENRGVLPFLLVHEPVSPVAECFAGHCKRFISCSRENICLRGDNHLPACRVVNLDVNGFPG